MGDPDKFCALLVVSTVTAFIIVDRLKLVACACACSLAQLATFFFKPVMVVRYVPVVCTVR